MDYMTGYERKQLELLDIQVDETKSELRKLRAERLKIKNRIKMRGHYYKHVKNVTRP